MNDIILDKLDKVFAKGIIRVANILVVSKFDTGQEFIKKVFSKEINLKELKKESVGIRKIDINGQVNIFFSNINSSDLKRVNTAKYDFIVYVASALTKRIDSADISNIERILAQNNKLIMVLSECEYLDERELKEMNEYISKSIENVEVLSIINENIECEANQIAELVYLISQNLDESCRDNFIKAQNIDNKGKKEINNNILSSYVEQIKNLEAEEFDKENIIYIANILMNDLLRTYGCVNEDISKAIQKVLEKSIDGIIAIKRVKIEQLLKIKAEKDKQEREEEKLRLEKIKKEAEERKEKEQLRKLEEEKIKKEIEARKKLEIELRKVEDARKRADVERIRLENEKKENEERTIKDRLRNKNDDLKKRRLKDESNRFRKDKNITDDDIKAKVKKMKTNIDDLEVIEASFTIDDTTEINSESTVNIIEEKIDEILDEILAEKMEELMRGLKEEIKSRLRENNII